MKIIHHKKQRQFLKNCKKDSEFIGFSIIRFTFVYKTKAYFVYCKVVKEIEYSSFLNC